MSRSSKFDGVFSVNKRDAFILNHRGLTDLFIVIQLVFYSIFVTYIFLLTCNNRLANESICELTSIFKEDYALPRPSVLEPYTLNTAKHKNPCTLCPAILCRKGILFGWLKYTLFKLLLHVEKYRFKTINIPDKVRSMFFLQRFFTQFLTAY